VDKSGAVNPRGAYSFGFRKLAGKFYELGCTATAEFNFWISANQLEKGWLGQFALLGPGMSM